jgi:diguanylate cyclase (GGDEF)-like protein
MSIKSNILAFAVLATLVPSVGLGIMSFVGYQDVINRSVDAELRALAKDAAGEVTLWTRERAHDLRTLSAAYTLVDGLGGAPPRPGAPHIGTGELNVYLQSVQRKLEPIQELTLVDTAGSVVAGSGESAGPVTMPASWPTSLVATGAVVLPPHWDDARAAPTVTIAVPVLSLRNEILGALFALLDLRSLEARLRNSVASAQGEVVVLAADGTPLISTRSPAGTLAKLDAAALVRVRGAADPTTFVDFRGQESLGIAALPTGLPFIVVAMREREDVFASWLSLVKTYALVVAGLTLLVGIVGYWMGRSIVAPLTALTTAADRVARGDYDVALHDETKDEIGSLTRSFTAMTDRLRASQAELEAANEALRRKNEELATLASTDSLTGLYNRRKLEQILRELFARFRDEAVPFALAMIEIDNLRLVNEEFGLVTGDDVMIKVAAIIKQSARATDYVARFGGERFVAVMPATPFDAAMELAERIRSLVEAPDTGPAYPIATAVSIGVAQSRQGDTDADTVLFRADHALHEAKRGGGNRVQSAM